MTMDRSTAEDVARRAVEGGSSNAFLDRLAERVGAQARVQAVFGEPIERGDLTVVPVARVRWGVGGGAGSSADTTGQRGPGSGAGGGAGVMAEPAGYLEIGPSGAVFRPIAHPYPSPVFLLAAGMSVAMILRALARLIRR